MSDVSSFMSFNNANPFSFDKLATPEAPGLLNGGTTSADDLTARTLFILEVIMLCRIPGTAAAAYFRVPAGLGLGCFLDPHRHF